MFKNQGNWPLIHLSSKFCCPNWFCRCKEYLCVLSQVLTGVCHLDLDLDMVIGLLYNHVPNLSSQYWFWSCKEHQCPWSPDLVFVGCWRILTWVPYLDCDLDMVTGLLYTYVPNFGSISWFWRCKEHPCPLSPDLELLRKLKVSDWISKSWFWVWYGHWFFIHPFSEFWLSILILKVQRTSRSFKS